METFTNYPALITEKNIVFKAEQPLKNAFLEIEFHHKWTENDYVFFPAACYDGNRFEVLKKEYPPMFENEKAVIDMPVTITDVPRLNKDGSGSMELTTGDVSVPCIGIFSKTMQIGILLFTVQQVNGHNLGLAYCKGHMKITYPAKRNKIYQWPFMTEKQDQGLDFKAGEETQIPYIYMEFDCTSLEEFYRVFFENRKCMGQDDTRPNVLPCEEQFEIQRNKFNTKSWFPEGGFYGVNVAQSTEQVWQPGWVGGGMSSYALMKLGGEQEWERGLSTLHHLFKTQALSGFFYESSNGKGEIGKSFHPENAKNWILLRKSADVLYFLFKHFSLILQKDQQVPLAFEEGTRKLADSFVNLWNNHGQFGQFVNVQTGELMVGGSTSAAIAPAGLVGAYQYFGDVKYLELAKESAEDYYQRDVLKGYTTGGPGEILQCPDSESAFALLESFVVLYQTTKEKKWLDYARHTAHLASSWVMSYNYQFPVGSEFQRLGMKTVGSIFANLQNKHSAPGICTLSGDSLHKLYKWTGNALYLELLRDIALTISQYMSTDTRPIYSWDLPKDPTLSENQGKAAEKEKLPVGFICERVNTSDWEGAKCVGGVFNGSCWSEVSNLLTLAETIDLLELEQKGN